jgi:hypothetical protein
MRRKQRRLLRRLARALPPRILPPRVLPVGARNRNENGDEDGAAAVGGSAAKAFQRLAAL